MLAHHQEESPPFDTKVRIFVPPFSQKEMFMYILLLYGILLVSLEILWKAQESNYTAFLFTLDNIQTYIISLHYFILVLLGLLGLFGIILIHPSHLETVLVREFGKCKLWIQGGAHNLRSQGGQFWLLLRWNFQKWGLHFSRKACCVSQFFEFCITNTQVEAEVFAGTFVSIWWIQNVPDHSSSRPFLRWNCHSSSILFRPTDIPLLLGFSDANVFHVWVFTARTSEDASRSKSTPIVFSYERERVTCNKKEPWLSTFPSRIHLNPKEIHFKSQSQSFSQLWIACKHPSDFSRQF